MHSKPEDPYAGPTAPELVGLTTEQRQDLARAKRAAVWVGLVAPLALVPVYVAMLITWLPQLPNPLATHWSGGGQPDGFSNHASFLLFTVGMSTGMALLMGSIARFGSGKGEIAVWSGMNRFMAAFSLTMSSSMGLMGVLIAWRQLGLDDAQNTGGVGGVVAAAFGVGIVLGAVAFAVQPRVHIEGAAKRAATPLPLTPTERAVWVAHARPSKMFLTVIGVTLLLMLVSTAVSAASALAVADGTGAGVAFWSLAGTTVLIVVLFATTTSFRVRVDDHGLVARSVVGWPVFRVPGADIDRVVATQISPMGEFGGWGLRWAPGRFGIVLRTGEGIVITRKDGRIFAITIDDAATGVGLLGAVAQR